MSISNGIAQAQFTIIDFPGAASTNVYDIDGNNAVGRYRDSNDVYHGLVYNVLTQQFTTLDNPAAVNDAFYGTFAEGIFGNTITGFYVDDIGSGEHSFLYDGTTYTNFDYPGADYGTTAAGISGNKVVGTYFATGYNDRHGFVYENGTSTTLDVPGASLTDVEGIDSNNIVGYYGSNSGSHGFLYTIVPEPNSMALLTGLGLTGAGFWPAANVFENPPETPATRPDLCYGHSLLPDRWTSRSQIKLPSPIDHQVDGRGFVVNVGIRVRSPRTPRTRRVTARQEYGASMGNEVIAFRTHSASISASKQVMRSGQVEDGEDGPQTDTRMFRYTVVDAAGEARTGTLAGQSAEELRAFLETQGYVVNKIRRAVRKWIVEENGDSYWGYAEVEEPPLADGRLDRQTVWVDREDRTIRLETRLAQVLDALAARHSRTVGELLEYIALQALAGAAATTFTRVELQEIEQLKERFGLDYEAGRNIHLREE